MNLDFRKLFRTGEKHPPVKIRTTRSMMLRPLDEPSRHVQAGEEITVAFDTLRELEGTDYTVIDSGRPKLEVTDPSPQREEPRPLPARWDELPACFADYWNLSEQFRTAREHVVAIIAERRRIFGSNISLEGAGDSGRIFMGGADLLDERKGVSGGVSSRLTEIDLSDPRLRALDRFLTAAENGARDYLDRLIDTKEIALQRAFLACGQHRLAVADELRALLDELAAIGYELFSIRSAPLGLADYHIRRLFHGSADYVKYASHPPAIFGSVRSAGLDQTGQPIPYSDQPVTSQACWSLDMQDRLRDLKPLLAEGKSELNRTRKAAKAA